MDHHSAGEKRSSTTLGHSPSRQQQDQLRLRLPDHYDAASSKERVPEYVGRSSIDSASSDSVEHEYESPSCVYYGARDDDLNRRKPAFDAALPAGAAAESPSAVRSLEIERGPPPPMTPEAPRYAAASGQYDDAESSDDEATAELLNSVFSDVAVAAATKPAPSFPGLRSPLDEAETAAATKPAPSFPGLRSPPSAWQMREPKDPTLDDDEYGFFLDDDEWDDGTETRFATWPETPEMSAPSSPQRKNPLLSCLSPPATGSAAHLAALPASESARSRPPPPPPPPLGTKPFVTSHPGPYEHRLSSNSLAHNSSPPSRETSKDDFGQISSNNMFYTDSMLSAMAIAS